MQPNDEMPMPPTPTGTAVPQEETESFEDLTLAEVVGRFRHAPLATLRAVVAVAQTPTYTASASGYEAGRPVVAVQPRYIPPAPEAQTQPDLPALTDEALVGEWSEAQQRSRVLIWAQLIVRIVAIAVAIFGGLRIFTPLTRAVGDGLQIAAPYWIAAFILWLVAAVIPRFERTARVRPSPAQAVDEPLLILSPVRIAAAAAGTICAVMAWIYNSHNLFTVFGVISWVASVILWVWAVAPAGWSPLAGVQQVGRRIVQFRPRLSWTLVALVAIMLVGGYFRFYELDNNPPEMTSDHVEKLRDVQAVLNGTNNVFFASNDGRDAIQFYALALLSKFPGLELNHHLLVLLTVIEGLITLPVLWWMGRQVMGERDRQLGNLVGLLMAALVAVSYWHEVLSRMGLRIVLTPLFVALVLGFLARGVRTNRRSDFIWAGIWLGIGLYAYQTVRILPVAIVATGVIALVFGVRTWAARRQMFVNFAVLVLVSFVIFVPLFRYAAEYPQDFMRRTTGRLFGEEGIREFDENGVITTRVPTLFEQIEMSLPQFVTNMQNAVLMYNFRSDAAWINNAPNFPAFDPYSGGLLIVGVAAWLVRMFRRRDAFDWSLIPIILIMMLASALSIAYPVENPSATRMSGTLPGVYLLAAFPLALVALELPYAIGRRVGRVVAAAGMIGIVALSFNVNWRTFFEDFRASYIVSSLPYSAGGAVLRDFAATNGYGNAFIIAYPYWWDHRALAIEGGRMDWGNTITDLANIPTYFKEAAERDNDLRLDPERDLLFFYSPDDAITEEWLQLNFPTGAARTVQTDVPNKPFKTYTVPALGYDDFARFLRRFDLEPFEG